RALELWRQRLAGAAGLLDLPLDHRRPRQQSFAGDAVSLELPAAIGAGMQRLAAAEKTTPFVAWLALVSVVLGRQAATEDVVVGVPVSNRSRSETERLVGFFLNTLPLRVQPRAGLSFAGLLGEVRTHTLAAFEDAELPFERIVDALRPSRDLSHSPIFQVLLTYDEAAPESLSLPGLEVEPLTVPTKTSQLDLSLHVRPRGDQVELSLEYCTALFERATIVRLGQALQAVAGAVLEHPEVPLRDLSFVPARQRAELIASWNPRTPAESETAVVLEAMVQEAMVLQTMVLQTIDRVAHERPDAVALEARSTTPEGGMRAAEKLTYRALRDRSAAIAGALAALELPGESLIAVALGRELDFVATCLAIWRVGGAVLPLDPSHPPARLEMILEDSGAALLIHAGDRVPLPVAPSLSVTSSLPMLDLSDVATDSGGVFEPASSPEALAYVLYTSGSTGRPKGVQISHGALASFLDAIAHDLPLAPGDELLAVTTFMFDIAFLELLLPLIQGAKTVILEQEATADPRRLAAAVECGGTRLLQATPSHWRMLVDSGWQGSDRLLIGCGGERLDTDLSAALVARCEQLWNLYGPTEATIWASTRRIPAAGPGASESIGSPLANSRFYLLDHRLEPMPQGTAAELFIAGDALARGYRGRSALTAERFLPDACGETAGARMYRTGDLVAFAANDGIRFLRRSDDQVKIQGHRIELAEVEQAARQLAAVNDGVAVVQDADSASGARLALHVVLADAEKDAGTEVAEIRARLQRQLPSYMVPTLIAGLAEVPLTPNGKVDRKRLPRLEPSEATAPASTLQEPLALELAALWEDVLGLESTDLDAGFFELGGTSLSAARLIYLIEKHLDVRLPVATLYEHPTPRGLLAVLRQEGVRHAGSTVQLRQGEGAPLFAFPGAGGNSVYFHALARSLPAGTAMVGLQAVGLDGDEAPQRTVAEMATHALTQIRQRQPQGPYWLLGHSLGGRVAFEVARRLEEAGERVAHLAVLDTPAPLPGTETAAPSRRDLEDPMAWLDELEEIVRVTTGHELELDAERLHQLSDDERVAAVAERLIAAGLLPDGRLARGFIHVYQANVRTAYEATQPIDAPITLLRVAREEAADATETATKTETETWGWEQLTRRGASSAQVPGEHISMLMPPHVGELAGQLANILTDTEEDVTGPRKSTPASGGVFSHG
ncbi:MAG: amino acid adenylation domain-containing protein, partial [Acidobacteriota bacterium]